MNKKILLTIIFVIVLCTGCGNSNKNYNKTTADLNIDTIGTYEWVSPDGVHYWAYRGYRTFGMSPRYDKDGQLVIDKED